MAEFPAPEEGIALTHFIVSEDVERSRRFYTDVLGGETVMEGRANDRCARERRDHHQRRRWPDRRQANGHSRNAPRPESGEQLPQHSRG
jgi:catechol 2,3-dioxygenase-like lactoylglutathione lyase family enzyme